MNTSATPQPTVLVLAVGNPSRGDDAVGPLLAERLQAVLADPAHPWRGHVEVLCDQQLFVEHALDLEGRRAVVFVDAAASSPGVVRVEPVRPAAQGLGLSTHSCTPGALLRLVQDTLRQTPPSSSLVSVGAQQFELGEPLHPKTEALLEQAWRALLHEVERGLALVPGAAHA